MRVIEDCLTAKNCKKCMLVSLVMKTMDNNNLFTCRCALA